MKLFPGVKPRFHWEGIDPLPKTLTMERMRQFPYDHWLRFIEGKITVHGHGEHDCWVWDPKNESRPLTDIATWTPQSEMTWRYKDRGAIKKVWNVRRFVAYLFYEFDVDDDLSYSVYRRKGICSWPNCVRPSHIIVAPHNNSSAKTGLLDV